MITGACNCGAVGFEVESGLSDIFVCHCSICRRFTGSNGIAVVLCKKSAFRWRQGEEKKATWAKPDTDWKSNFCSVCGSALPGSDSEEWMFIPAGLIEDVGENLKVAHHIWVGSKASWDVIGDAGKLHAEAFAG